MCCVVCLAMVRGCSVLFGLFSVCPVVPKLALGLAQSCESMADLLSRSDFVTLHVPKTAETVKLIGERVRRRVALLLRVDWFAEARTAILLLGNFYDASRIISAQCQPRRCGTHSLSLCVCVWTHFEHKGVACACVCFRWMWMLLRLRSSRAIWLVLLSMFFLT